MNLEEKEQANSKSKEINYYTEYEIILSFNKKLQHIL